MTEATATATAMATTGAALARRQSSRLLQSFRAIGLVVDAGVPLRWYGMGAASFATASLGKAFAVYKCDRLSPVLVSPQMPKRIAALEVLPKRQLTLTACGRHVLVWKRVEQVATLTGHQGAIKQVRWCWNWEWSDSMKF